jgi:hypothetical protein
MRSFSSSSTGAFCGHGLVFCLSSFGQEEDHSSVQLTTDMEPQYMIDLLVQAAHIEGF